LPCWRRSATAPTAGGKKISCQQCQSESKALARWPVQEIRRIATRLAQRRIEPADVIAWSLWRRAHQAAAQRAYMKRNMQL
jgi:hypothetical protein